MANTTKPSSFTLAIDKRERDILTVLNAYIDNKYYDSKGNHITWRAEHLTIGDYIIFYNNIAVMVIERKTWTDLAASFRDGRKENIRKLKQFNEQTGAIIAYLIEGIAIPSHTNKFARIPYGNLRAHLDHLLVRDHIIELHSTNHHTTIQRLFEIIKNTSTMQTTEFLNMLKSGGYSNYAEVPNPKVTNPEVPNTEVPNLEVPNPEVLSHLELAQVQFKVNESEIIDKLWCIIPGITINSVKLFRRYHISDLLLGILSEATISKMSYGNGRIIGNKKARKIANIAKLENRINTQYYLRIISNIPGISRKTAEKILESFSMEKIIKDWITIRKDLVKLSRGKTKLGEHVVSTIEKYLIKNKEIMLPIKK